MCRVGVLYEYVCMSVWLRAAQVTRRTSGAFEPCHALEASGGPFPPSAGLPRRSAPPSPNSALSLTPTLKLSTLSLPPTLSGRALRQAMYSRVITDRRLATDARRYFGR